ncbi:hypothetical protein CTI12_AA090540 [Artemisia annua]|uniref:Glycosyltransferase family 92 protein n=1 Tax=Artemisia annua TaxID=35608 RepID=A0A2U1PZR9_ARTAN|nr:hypothetical protein CTI12_AA090540 [Artemisia annua]
MDSPEQRRKRKRNLKPTTRLIPPVKSLVYFVFFFIFFYLLFKRHTLALNDVVSSSSLSSLSITTSFTSSYKGLKKFGQFSIQARVSFPDHVLLLVKKLDVGLGSDPVEFGVENRLECVYRSNGTGGQRGVDRLDVLSVDEYTDDRLIVRCPLLGNGKGKGRNFTEVSGLRRRGVMVGVGDDDKTNRWENLAYEAVLDGNTAVVFVKGISHRQDKESDPNQFTITAAQEVVRCVLPRSMAMHPEKARGVRATVSFRMPRVRGRSRRVVVPSVARIDTELGARSEKRELCACTMLWNQGRSIREWIMYHSWLGVEKWFIYDNNSDDEITDVIKNLNFEGYNVSRHVWPWIKTQEAGFSHCALRARSECNWVSFMDVDEFYYFPYNKGYSGQGSLKTLVSNYTNSSTIGEIRTSCHSFGPSGLTSRPRKGVMVGYTCRLQSPERHKSIIRPDALDTTLMNVVHHFHLKKGFTFMDLHQNVAVINHYKYQVWEVFRAKFYRRVATYVADWKDNQNEGSRDRAPGLGTEAIEPPDWRRQFCEVWDTGLRDFVLANLADVTNGVLPWDRDL